jgi:hypothetical protein
MPKKCFEAKRFENASEHMKKSIEKGEPFYFRTICCVIKQGKIQQISLGDDLIN